MPSSVITDLVANDKVTAATKQAVIAVQQYAQSTRVALASSRESWQGMSQSIGKYGSMTSQAAHGAMALTQSIGAISGSGAASQAIGAINALITGIQSLTAAQAVAQAFMGPKGWAVLAAGAAAAVAAVAMVSSAFKSTKREANDAGDAMSRQGKSTAVVAKETRELATAEEEQAKQIAKARQQYRLAVEAINDLREAQAQYAKMRKPGNAEFLANVTEALPKRIEQRNEAIKAAHGFDLSTWKDRYESQLRPLKKLLEEHIISAEEFATQTQRLQESMGRQESGIEQYRRAIARLSEEFREGKRTQQAFAEAMKDLAAKQFGPLLTESLQEKINQRFADIEQDFQQRFGRNLTPAQAAAEREARRKAAVSEATGLGPTPQEKFDEAMKLAAVARGAGNDSGAAKIEQDAHRERQQSIRDEARQKAGLGGPFEDLLTNAERLKVELIAIQKAYQGGYGGAGTKAAKVIVERSVAKAREQYGPRGPEPVQARFEGLQDTWRRIQESAASKGNSPEERTAKAAEENKILTAAVLGESKNFNANLKTAIGKLGPARAG